MVTVTVHLRRTTLEPEDVCAFFYIYLFQPEDVWSNTLTFHVWPILRNGLRVYSFYLSGMGLNVHMAQNLTLEKKRKCVVLEC